MTPERTKEMRRIYHGQMEAVQETLTIALCETYKGITGKEPSERMRDEIANAIRYNT